jgi:hypothetical protein
MAKRWGRKYKSEDFFVPIFLPVGFFPVMNDFYGWRYNAGPRKKEVSR